MQIEIKDISFAYSKKSKTVLDGLNLTLSSGFSYVLTGQNGSGKTTLSKIICGLLKPASGSVLIDGEDTKKWSAGRIASRVGYLFQNPDLQLFATTVLEELTFPFEITKALTDDVKKRAAEVLEEFGLSGMENRFPLLMSGGEKQRLALATIAIRNAEFLILDEPSSSIDADGRGFLADYINKFTAGGGGVMIITHDEEFAAMIENRKELKMAEGRI